MSSLLRLRSTLIIVFILMLIFILVATYDGPRSPEAIPNSYRDKEFSGHIVERYVDEDEHMFQKVVIEHEYGERTILLNHETGGLFHFLELNDSIIKELGSLEVRIIRNNLDTIIKMKFD